MKQADGHHYFEGLAVAHVLGGLDDSEGRVFRAHLLECVDCRARVGELRAIAHDLADVERDERRVRAARVVDTKRREDDDEEDSAEEPPEASRASRVTVIVGLLLVMGLSLWNFTLRGALTAQQQDNKALVAAGVIQDSGTTWPTVREAAQIDASVRSKAGDFVITVDGLDPEQIYGLYTVDAAGKTISQRSVTPLDGRMFETLQLPADATSVVLVNPDDANERVGRPTAEREGETLFEADRP